MAKYMLVRRGTAAGRADAATDSSEDVAAMGRYHERMMDAGVLSAGESLADAAEGAVVDFSGDIPVASDGPPGERTGLLHGFWILEVATQDDAVEWARRAPLSGPGTTIEVRRVHGPEDFPADDEWAAKEQRWRAELGTE